jgi:hypothetical protein
VSSASAGRNPVAAPRDGDRVPGRLDGSAGVGAGQVDLGERKMHARPCLVPVDVTDGVPADLDKPLGRAQTVLRWAVFNSHHSPRDLLGDARGSPRAGYRETGRPLGPRRNLGNAVGGEPARPNG